MISTEDFDRIASADHPDPHAILGPHEEGGALVIRAYRPDALGVRILPDDGSSAHEMTKVHGLGIFELRLPNHRLPYRYRVEARHALATRTTLDPYAFPPSLGALDLHLAAEGTHLEIYRHLG